MRTRSLLIVIFAAVLIFAGCSSEVELTIKNLIEHPKGPITVTVDVSDESPAIIKTRAYSGVIQYYDEKNEKIIELETGYISVSANFPGTVITPVLQEIEGSGWGVFWDRSLEVEIKSDEVKTVTFITTNLSITTFTTNYSIEFTEAE